MFWLLIPRTAHAAPTFTSLYNNIVTQIVNPLIVILCIIALVIFLWGVAEYMRGDEKSDARKNGAQHILWGIIGLTIMLGVWGILSLIVNTFDFKSPPNSGVNIKETINNYKQP